MSVRLPGGLQLPRKRIIIPARLEQSSFYGDFHSPENISSFLNSLAIQEHLGLISFGEGEAWLDVLVRHDKGKSHV